MDRIPIKSNPRLFDKPFALIQSQIGEKIDWLDHVFGLCEKITVMENGRAFKSANVYVGGENYAQIMPCSELGNFCFFMLKDPQERVGANRNYIYSPFYAVFWYNVMEVSSSADDRNREAVKEEILQVLNTIRTPYIEWERLYERPENIFDDFTYDFTRNQYLMSPYAGIRVEGRIRAEIPCWKGKCGDFNNDFNNDYSNRHCEGEKQKKDFSKDYNKDYR